MGSASVLWAGGWVETNGVQATSVEGFGWGLQRRGGLAVESSADGERKGGTETEGGSE